jgi:hypothetical protein
LLHGSDFRGKELKLGISIDFLKIISKIGSKLGVRNGNVVQKNVAGDHHSPGEGL